MSITVLYSDAAVIAVNKPPGMPVHEAPGPRRSLLRELREQAGLVAVAPAHRIDMDASGVLILARTREAASELQRHWPEAEKTYTALCEGLPANEQGAIDAPILEHQTAKPERMANAVKYYEAGHPGETLPPLPPAKSSAVHPAGRAAQTDYHVLEKFGRWSLLEVRPHQGRMHQIRVHLAHAGLPLAVDPLYGKRAELREKDLHEGGGERVLLSRLSLHAAKLTFLFAGKKTTVEAPLADDVAAVLFYLRG